MPTKPFGGSPPGPASTSSIGDRVERICAAETRVPAMGVDVVDDCHDTIAARPDVDRQYATVE